jgi:hypothetical protein
METSHRRKNQKGKDLSLHIFSFFFFFFGMCTVSPSQQGVPNIHLPNLLFKVLIDNEEDSQTFDSRVSPLVGAATHESNVWVMSDKGRKREKQIANHLVLKHI